MGILRTQVVMTTAAGCSTRSSHLPVQQSAKPLQDALTQQSARCSIHGPQGEPWSNQQHSCGCQVGGLLSHQQGVSANLPQDGWSAVSPDCRALRSTSAFRGEVADTSGAGEHSPDKPFCKAVQFS